MFDAKQESIRQKQRGIQVEEELKMRDQELEITLMRQKEVRSNGPADIPLNKAVTQG